MLIVIGKDSSNAGILFERFFNAFFSNEYFFQLILGMFQDVISVTVYKFFQRTSK